MESIIFGALSAVLIGFADFFAAVVGRKVGSFFTLLYSMITSFLILVVCQFFLGHSLITWGHMPILLGVGLVTAVAYLAFYKALELGPVSIVAPIASADGAIAAGIGLLLFAEVLRGGQVAALVIVLASIFLVSTDLSQFKKSLKKPGKGSLYAMVTMVGFGIALAGISWMSGLYGWFIPILAIRFAILIPLFGVAAAGRKWKAEGEEEKVSKSSWGLVLLIGVLETAALLCYAYGTHLETTAPTALVAPLYATFPMVTGILAYIFFKERPVWNQWLGIAGVIGGMIFLAVS